MPTPQHQSILASVPRPLYLDPISGPTLSPVEVRPGTSVVLGRSSQCQVVLADESVSRRHAQIAHAGNSTTATLVGSMSGAWMISDLGSRHGTHVNAVAITPNQAAPLKHGDIIGIGPWSFRVRLSDAATSTHITTTVSEASPKERVERVNERELAAITRNRLNLLIDVAAAVGSASDESTLARTIAKAAVDGTGFPRAAVLLEVNPSAPDSTRQLRVICSLGPEGLTGEVGSPTPSELLRIKHQAAASLQPHAFSHSLINLAKQGEVARMTADTPLTGSESIMRLGIQTALCAPVPVGSAIGGYLYLDSRSGEATGATPFTAARPVATVQNDAAAFLSALAKMYGLALANISRQELERRQRELERDLDAAREAQRMVMPPEQGRLGPLCYAMRCKSGRYVAGDLFDVVPLPDNRVAVFLGDVAGKGISAAILMATAQAHLNLALKTTGDLAAAVRSVNAHVCAHAAESRFISLWIGVFDPAKSCITYVDAGHGHWLLRPATGHAHRPHVESAGGIPLGIDDAFDYSAGIITLSPGDRLIVFSDGVVEQPGNDTGSTLFGIERAVAALSASPSPESDVAALFSSVIAFAGTDALADDTTVASIALG